MNEAVQIYEVGANGFWTGAIRDIAWDAGAPPGWTRQPVPSLGAGEAARWLDGAWRVVDAASALPTLEQLRTAKLAVLAAYRWQREIGGCVVGGVTVRTDRESQALLTGAAVAAMLEGAGYEVTWKAMSGWVTLTGAETIGLASAVRTHVQACFDRERVLALEIEAAGTAQQLDLIDITSGWPVAA